MDSKSKVYFFFDNVAVSLVNRKELKRFIESIFRKEGKKLKSLNYIFCSDRRLLEINRQFLSHDYYTDIITFDMAEKGASIQGEIYISIDRVRDNAKTLHVPIKTELHRVIFHGALHLCGYSDKTNKEKEKMREKEDWALKRYHENRK